MPNKPRRILSLLLAALMFCASAVPAMAEETVQSAQAAAMQLMRTEGTVTVTNNTGRALSTRDNMNLYNGYRVGTGAASYAWISLDSAKLTKLDAVSEAELRKSGKVLELLLNSGALFFNVTSPLEEDETLNIRTSTMVVGIRGTSGWIRLNDRWSAEIYVLEGSVECSVADPVTGQVKTATIQSGQKATAMVYPQDQAGDKCDILLGQYEVDEIDGFALVELAADPALCEKILAASGMDIRGALGVDPEVQDAPQDALEAAAQARLEKDQQTMQGILDNIAGQLAQQEQESNSSAGFVWEREERPSASEAPAQPQVPEVPEQPQVPEASSSGSGSGSSSSGSSSDRDTSGSSSSGSGSGSGSGGNSGSGSSDSSGSSSSSESSSSESSSVQDTIELFTPLNAAEVTEAFGTDGVKEVKISVGTDKDHPQFTIDSSLTVPSGKTLTINKTVYTNVHKGSALTIEGTMVGGYLGVLEGGTVNVNSSNTLEMSGQIAQIVNSGTFNNNAKGRTVTNQFENLGTLNNAGTMECAITNEGTFHMSGGTVTAPTSDTVAVTVNKGSFTLKNGTVDSEVFVDDGGTFAMEGGTLLGGDEPALVVVPGGSLYMSGGEVTSSTADGTVIISTGEGSVIEFAGGTVANTGTGVAVSFPGPEDVNIGEYTGTIFKGNRMDMILVSSALEHFQEEYGEKLARVVTIFRDYVLSDNSEQGYYSLTYDPENAENPSQLIDGVKHYFRIYFSQSNGEEVVGGEEPGEDPTEPVDGNEILRALAEAEGGTVVFLSGDAEADLTSNLTIANGDTESSVILDLNGYTLNITVEEAEFAVSGALTIIDSSGGAGKLEMNAPVYVVNGGRLSLFTGTIDAGTDYSGSTGDFHPVLDISGGSTFYMESGTVTGHGSYPAVRATGGSLFEIRGGTVEPKVFIQNSSSMILDRGVIDASEYSTVIDTNSEFYVKSGTLNGSIWLESSAYLNMEGGEIVSLSADVVPVSADSTARLELWGGEITNSGEGYVMFCTDSALPELYIPNIENVTIRAKQRDLFATYSGGDLIPTEYSAYTSTDSADSDGYFYLRER